jgi:hypothetical protein
MNPTINFCRTFEGCLPRLRRLSFFRPSVSSKSFRCRACIFSTMSSLLLHPLIHCTTTNVTPACDAAVYFLTLFDIAILWLLMNVAIFCVVELSKNSSISAWNNPISTGCALSFKLFSFLALILSFDILVVSYCSVVLPCTSSFRCSHNLMKYFSVISIIKAPHT